MTANRSSNTSLVSLISSFIVILSMTLSLIAPHPASAQEGDGLRRQVNVESGRVSFIGPENGRALQASRALGLSRRPQDPGMALVERYGREFGLRNPGRELAEVRNSQAADGNPQHIARFDGELLAHPFRQNNPARLIHGNQHVFHTSS